MKGPRDLKDLTMHDVPPIVSGSMRKTAGVGADSNATDVI